MALLEIKQPHRRIRDRDRPVHAPSTASTEGRRGRGAGHRRRIRLGQVGLDAGGDGPAARTATVTADEMTFDGRDMLNHVGAERRKIIGKDIAMIFQEPMTSPQPVLHRRLPDRGSAALPHGMDKRRPPRPRDRTVRAGRHPRTEAERLKPFPHQMSGGQCQRVMIAMAIACNPKLLIADEPTTALDVTIQKQILDLLMKLQAEHGMGLIMITHNMGVVAETADRVVVQYKGRKMEEADVLSTVREPEEPLHPRAALGPAGKRHRRPPAHRVRATSRFRGGRRDDPVVEGRAHQARLHIPAACSAAPHRSCREGRELQGREGQDAGHRRRIRLGQVDAGPHHHADRPAHLGELLIDGQQARRHRHEPLTAGDAPQGADRVPEPLWLAQPAPEDRRRADGAAAASTPTCRPTSAATAPWRC
jgi:dipeptide transport system ATP-binding protein